MPKKLSSQNDSLTKDKYKDQLDQLDQKWKRALADYQNLEKRVKNQQVEFVKFASAALIDKLLTVVDDLERAASHTKDKGIGLIASQFKDILKTEGVEEIIALGKKFDPETMDATEMTTGKKNIINKIVLKGYTLNGKVLRPAKVHVGKGGN